MNTIKYIKATMASNFGNFYAVAITSLFIPFLPMLPIQILLLNLLSDFPMISIATDRVTPRDIARPMRYDLKDIILVATVFGIVSTAFDFLYFALFFRLGPEHLQTNWFIGSILTELLFLFSIRSREPFFRSVAPSRLMVLLSGMAALATVALPYTSIGRTVFHFASPTPKELGTILLVAGLFFIATELVKYAYYRVISRSAALSER